MDDPPDRSYSRAPELRDLAALCRSLNRENVRYLLIGGFAVVLHGSVRTTKDIDLLVDVRLAPDRRTLDRAYKAAPKEKWRRQLTAQWVSLDGESWPYVILLITWRRPLPPASSVDA